jgi:hypothetical protein
MTSDELLWAIWEPANGERPELHRDFLEALLVVSAMAVDRQGLLVFLKPGDVFQPWLLKQMKACATANRQDAVLPKDRSPLERIAHGFGHNRRERV